MRISWPGMDGWTALWVATATAFYLNIIYHTNNDASYISLLNSAFYSDWSTLDHGRVFPLMYQDTKSAWTRYLLQFS